MENNLKNNPNKRHRKDTKREYANRLFFTFYEKPKSRREAATIMGYPDQTYMVTQFVNDWIKQGKAYVIGIIKCSRSGRFVQAVSTNPELAPVDNQLNLF